MRGPLFSGLRERFGSGRSNQHVASVFCLLVAPEIKNGRSFQTLDGIDLLSFCLVGNRLHGIGIDRSCPRSLGFYACDSVPHARANLLGKSPKLFKSNEKNNCTF